MEESNKYFWNTKDNLGTGATAQVFAGYSRVSGGDLSHVFVLLGM